MAKGKKTTVQTKVVKGFSKKSTNSKAVKDTPKQKMVKGYKKENY